MPINHCTKPNKGMAMEDCGFSKKDIRHVVGQLYEVFDLNSVEDAKEKYHSSPY